MSRSCMLPAWVAIYGTAVLAVPILATSSSRPVPPPVTAPPSEISETSETSASEPERHPDPLVGIWAEPAAADEDRVRFYYFHGDGHGLYRYGRRATTFTNSFDYTVDGGVIALEFRKTGVARRVPFTIDRDAAGNDRLVLTDDPRGDGRGVYVRTRRDPVEHGAQQGPGVGGRMWLDRTAYATGGYGFALYQMRPAGIDGRGTGWFHRGDFDDWSTESLVYRMSGDRIELVFEATGERHGSRFTVEPGDPAHFVLAEDPRDWWHTHRYVDVGPSFGAHDGSLDARFDRVVAP